MRVLPETECMLFGDRSQRSSQRLEIYTRLVAPPYMYYYYSLALFKRERSLNVDRLELRQIQSST